MSRQLPTLTGEVSVEAVLDGSIVLNGTTPVGFPLVLTASQARRLARALCDAATFLDRPPWIVLAQNEGRFSRG
jgi:hypothetical protein